MIERLLRHLTESDKFADLILAINRAYLRVKSQPPDSPERNAEMAKFQRKVDDLVDWVDVIKERATKAERYVRRQDAYIKALEAQLKNRGETAPANEEEEEEEEDEDKTVQVCADPKCKSCRIRKAMSSGDPEAIKKVVIELFGEDLPPSILSMLFTETPPEPPPEPPPEESKTETPATAPDAEPAVT